MNLNWEALIQPQQTVVVYMGIKGLELLCNELIKRGMSVDMPAAIVQQGTTQQQRVYIGTLKTLPELPKLHVITPPSMIIIGEVVKLHEKLAWFEPTEGVA
jgi:uroporphyrin-III C-methyltransferase/precorrin-2 dehydrogenase/sirohydrochlorin ferrochelatase